MGEVAIWEDDVHETADGKRLWVVHGNLFDNVTQHIHWLAYLGDHAYAALLKLNRVVNFARSMFNMPYWSLSQFLKHRVKSAVSFISAFETPMLNETRRRRCDGVVCGHIHKPEMLEVNGLLYLNDGDWVESLSALVEHHDGRLELLNWQNARSTIKRKAPDSMPEHAPAIPGVAV